MRIRRGITSLAVVVAIAACGTDSSTHAADPDVAAATPTPSDDREVPEPQAPEPTPAAPPREFPTPAPEPAPSPTTPPRPAEPVPPPAAPAVGAVEVAIAAGGFGAFGDARRRTLIGSTSLPAGSIIAYEVVPARYDWATGLWRADDASEQARRGLVEPQPRESSFNTMWGTMTHDFEIQIDITGFPCAPSEPHDVLDVEACPLAARFWFATVLEGPWGQVQQPQSVRDVVGERGERMTAPPCVGCSTLGARDRARVEYTWPRVDAGAMHVASTRFLSGPLNPDRFRP